MTPFLSILEQETLLWLCAAALEAIDVGQEAEAEDDDAWFAGFESLFNAFDGALFCATDSLWGRENVEELGRQRSRVAKALVAVVVAARDVGNHLQYPPIPTVRDWGTLVRLKRAVLILMERVLAEGWR